jgi:hypothetical protein
MKLKRQINALIGSGCVFILLIYSCQGPAVGVNTSGTQTEEQQAEPLYAWTQLLDSAAWRKNYNFQLFSIRDTLRVFHPDGCWYSLNGNDWTRSPLPDAIGNSAFLDYVYFRDAVYALGYLKGNIEQFDFKPQISRSTDLKTWTTLSEKSNLPRRFFYHPFVFNNRIWIIGGEDAQRKYADIWNSEDGITWIRQKDSAAFGPRSGSQVVLLNDTLYLLDNDVWCSADGLHWQLRSQEILKGEQLFGYSAQVLHDKIWLIGCNRNAQFTSQVLYSSDGIHWQTQTAPWLPRGGVAAAVHRDGIYMTGGKYGGTPDHPDFRYDNDVWCLAKK